MTVRQLHNEDWGFDSNCFVCEPRNPGGLRIPFLHDSQRSVVTATFTLDETFSGAPAYVHGGVSLAILDEAQAWATIALAGKFAVTTETCTRFGRPVLVGRTYTVEARVTAVDGDTISTSAQIGFAADKVCAESTATFAVLAPAQAVKAIGMSQDRIDPSYLRTADPADPADRADPAHPPGPADPADPA